MSEKFSTSPDAPFVVAGYNLKPGEKQIDLTSLRKILPKYSTSAIHAIFGFSQDGKTTFILQLMCEFSHKTGKTAVLYDTEGGGIEFVNAWLPRHRKLYPKAKILVIKNRNWKNILKAHGTFAILDTSEKAKKRSVKIVSQTDNSEISAYIKKNNVGFIFYDSVTAPMKAFGSNPENFPARNDAQTIWFQSMIDLIDEHEVVIWASHHATQNPMKPYAPIEITGGSAVRYFSKIILHIKKWEAKGIKAYRSIKLFRYFDQPPLETEAIFELTDSGFVSKTESDQEEARKLGMRQTK